jgi:hypothetical protein
MGLGEMMNDRQYTALMPSGCSHILFFRFSHAGIQVIILDSKTPIPRFSAELHSIPFFRFWSRIYVPKERQE